MFGTFPYHKFRSRVSSNNMSIITQPMSNSSYAKLYVIKYFFNFKVANGVIGPFKLNPPLTPKRTRTELKRHNKKQVVTRF